ncbi:MAG: hypothetical protein E6845_17390 [Clostridium sp.]|nr:hypothetical protein [Clostridium sp.]MDU1604734.1 hypothetical protein [Clostridium sp.]
MTLLERYNEKFEEVMERYGQINIVGANTILIYNNKKNRQRRN